MTVRVRFAPSPTGYLHVGGARTALFNWLFARHEEGVFLLRIEDTDRARSSPEMTRIILDGLEWLGVTIDEGPVFQADGVERHREEAFALLERGAAYRCFCTSGDLRSRREEAERTGAGFGYDGRCGDLSVVESEARAAAEEPFALRVRVPDEAIGWEDLIHGPMSFPAGAVDDFIVLRSDGTPVYNLAVVSDDRESRITHVIRGDDHISNTPKQIVIYRALESSIPIFAHVPLILGPDAKRLSKRHGAMSVLAYQEQGFLAQGVMNFLALLGWSPGDDRELFGLDELVSVFEIGRVLKKSAVFDLEKLEWLNGQHIANSPASVLAPDVIRELRARAVDGGLSLSKTHPTLETSGDRLTQILDLVKSRPRTIPALAGQVSPFFAETIDYESSAVDRFWTEPKEASNALRDLGSVFDQLDEWSLESLETVTRALAERLGVGAGRLINPLRVALMGQGVSPGIFEVVLAMGRDRVKERIVAATGFLDAKAVEG